jgi:hypothetical protein
MPIKSTFRASKKKSKKNKKKNKSGAPAAEDSDSDNSLEREIHRARNIIPPRPRPRPRPRRVSPLSVPRLSYFINPQNDNINIIPGRRLRSIDPFLRLQREIELLQKKPSLSQQDIARLNLLRDEYHLSFPQVLPNQLPPSITAMADNSFDFHELDDLLGRPPYKSKATSKQSKKHKRSRLRKKRLAGVLKTVNNYTLKHAKDMGHSMKTLRELFQMKTWDQFKKDYLKNRGVALYPVTITDLIPEINEFTDLKEIRYAYLVEEEGETPQISQYKIRQEESTGDEIFNTGNSTFAPHVWYKEQKEHIYQSLKDSLKDSELKDFRKGIGYLKNNFTYDKYGYGTPSSTSPSPGSASTRRRKRSRARPRRTRSRS